MRTEYRTMVPALLMILALTGCVGAPQSKALLQAHRADALPLSSPVLLDDVPFHPQEDYQCGPAALATILQHDGLSITPDALVDQVYVPARQGSLQVEMLAAPRRYGRISYQLSPELSDLLAEVEAGRPVLVMQNLGLTRLPQWHYAVVVGYDLEEGKLTLRSGVIRDYRVSIGTFERTWSRAQNWAMVVMRPGEMPITAKEDNYFQSVSAFQNSADAQDLQLGYEAGLARWPHSLNLGMGKANLLYSEGDLNGAATDYRELVAQHPDSAATHNNLAQVLLELGHVAEAERHARSAVALGGTFSDVYARTLRAVEQRANEQRP